jgi:hypothetical protein
MLRFSDAAKPIGMVPAGFRRLSALNEGHIIIDHKVRIMSGWLASGRPQVTEDHPSNEGAASRIWNDARRAAVIEEMNLILAHPIFKTSNRCIALLRYVIDHALAGKEDEIKERTLGIEVFGRSATYDLSTDPIVRRVASEIRKRLAQH